MTPSPLSGGTLGIRDLDVSFGGVHAVRDFSLDLASGSIHGLIGPNGAGKSTVFNAVSGFVGVNRGHITLDDVDLSRLAPHKRAGAGLARTFQNLGLFPEMTVLDNVMVAQFMAGTTGVLRAALRSPRARRDEDNGRAASLQAIAAVGIDQYRTDTVGELPYGIQKRVELARALAMRPRVLLLDEPMAGMRPAEKTSLGDSIRGLLGQGVSVLVIEHDMAVISRLADVVTVMNYGEVIARGTPEVVRSDPEVVRAYLGSEGGGTTRQEVDAP